MKWVARTLFHIQLVMEIWARVGASEISMSMSFQSPNEMLSGAPITSS